MDTENHKEPETQNEASTAEMDDSSHQIASDNSSSEQEPETLDSSSSHEPAEAATQEDVAEESAASTEEATGSQEQVAATSEEPASSEEGSASMEASNGSAEDEVSADDAEATSVAGATTNPNLKWFVVHTYSMFEEKAKLALLERIKQFNSEEHFGEIVVPKTSSEQVLKSGKKKTVEKTSFPGYIIVQMEMTERTNHIVRDTPKVTGFVGNAHKPRPITDQEVLRLTSPEAAKEQKKAEASNLSFEKGESVKVTDGAFTNFDGVVEAVDSEKLKLRILVSIFGRETPVELDYGQVEKLS